MVSTPYAQQLTGRAFTTRLEFPEEPVWGPLESVAALARSTATLPSFHEGEFMYMAMVLSERKKLAIHLYKHVDTRRYLNLDDGGHAYAYRDSALSGLDVWSGGRYQRYRSLAHAIEHLQLWLFEEQPRFFRSFPPDQWSSAG